MFIFLNMVLCSLKPSQPSHEVGKCFALVFIDVETKTIRNYSNLMTLRSKDDLQVYILSHCFSFCGYTNKLSHISWLKQRKGMHHSYEG